MKAYLSLFLIVFLLIACVPAPKSLNVADATDKPILSMTLGHENDLSIYYGNTPPAAILIVNEQKQEAGVGTSTWTLEKVGQAQTTVVGDAFGLVTPVQPLPVSASFSASLRLPIPASPSILWYSLKLVTNSIERSTSSPDTTSWQVDFGQPGTSLDLKREQAISFFLQPGQYLLEVYAEWPELGSVDYGFFVDVQAEDG